jgi:inosose dehydratase
MLSARLVCSIAAKKRDPDASLAEVDGSRKMKAVHVGKASNSTVRGTPIMKIACQTATWEMFGEQWAGRIDDVLDAIASAGYEGVEFGDRMIREYSERPHELARAVRARGLSLAAYSIAPASGCTDLTRREGDVTEIEHAMRFVEKFEEALLVIDGPSTDTAEAAGEKIAVAAGFFNEAGRCGLRAGVPVAFHPSSRPGSIVRGPESYQQIMNRTDPSLVGWAADTGEIFRTGQLAADTMARYRDRIRHVHVRDVDGRGEWRPVGQGISEVRRAIALLADNGYQDWLVIEDQSVEAWTAPDRIIVMDLQYIGRLALG